MFQTMQCLVQPVQEEIRCCATQSMQYENSVVVSAQEFLAHLTVYTMF